MGAEPFPTTCPSGCYPAATIYKGTYENCIATLPPTNGQCTGYGMGTSCNAGACVESLGSWYYHPCCHPGEVPP